MNHEEGIIQSHELNFRELYEQTKRLEVGMNGNTGEILHIKSLYASLTADIKDINIKLDTLQNKLLNRLPPWGNIVINLLVALVTGLIIYLVKT